MRTIGSYWDKHFLTYEMVTAIAVTFGVAVYVFAFAESALAESSILANRVTVYRVAATVGSALLGFTGTIVAVIYGLIDAERLKHLRRSAQRATLWRVFFSAMRCLGLLVLVSFAGLIADHKEEPIMPFAIAFLYASLLALFRMARSVWLLQRIIEIMALPPLSDRP